MIRRKKEEGSRGGGEAPTPRNFALIGGVREQKSPLPKSFLSPSSFLASTRRRGPLSLSHPLGRERKGFFFFFCRGCQAQSISTASPRGRRSREKNGGKTWSLVLTFFFPSFPMLADWLVVHWRRLSMRYLLCRVTFSPLVPKCIFLSSPIAVPHVRIDACYKKSNTDILLHEEKMCGKRKDKLKRKRENEFPYWTRPFYPSFP